uniref:LOW QUALITY PROTEIN: GAS2-like protein 1 n=1 Tax=Petromyzon marinus TaxID=7757 RepID=A0AAJ7TTI6_PETMA|nr:LOW QUALITY PROTEIN: GAS2-like protein 1 [Petromyzon marinus]
MEPLHPAQVTVRAAAGRSVRPYRSELAYLHAMKEDLAQWLNVIFSDVAFDVSADNFTATLSAGWPLCRLANAVSRWALDCSRARDPGQGSNPGLGAHGLPLRGVPTELALPVPSTSSSSFSTISSSNNNTFLTSANTTGSSPTSSSSSSSSSLFSSSSSSSNWKKGLNQRSWRKDEEVDVEEEEEEEEVVDQDDVERSNGVMEQRATFAARDRVATFLGWCRSELGIPEHLTFETNDLMEVGRQERRGGGERQVVLCLLEVARRGARWGGPAPELVMLERDIEVAEALAAGQEVPVAGVGVGATTRPRSYDFKNLDLMVRKAVSVCTCPAQFPVRRVADGKYRVGDSSTLIHVRILRTHVMVRVGGGWDSLQHYLDKHDPCRCMSSAHRRVWQQQQQQQQQQQETDFPRSPPSNPSHSSPKRKAEPNQDPPSRRSTTRTTPSLSRSSTPLRSPAERLRVSHNGPSSPRSRDHSAPPTRDQADGRGPPPASNASKGGTPKTPSPKTTNRVAAAPAATPAAGTRPHRDKTPRGSPPSGIAGVPPAGLRQKEVVMLVNREKDGHHLLTRLEPRLAPRRGRSRPGNLPGARHERGDGAEDESASATPPLLRPAPPRPNPDSAYASKNSSASSLVAARGVGGNHGAVERSDQPVRPRSPPLGSALTSARLRAGGARSLAASPASRPPPMRRQSGGPTPSRVEQTLRLVRTKSTRRSKRDWQPTAVVVAPGDGAARAGPPDGKNRQQRPVLNGRPIKSPQKPGKARSDTAHAAQSATANGARNVEETPTVTATVAPFPEQQQPRRAGQQQQQLRRPDRVPSFYKLKLRPKIRPRTDRVPDACPSRIPAPNGVLPRSRRTPPRSPAQTASPAKGAAREGALGQEATRDEVADESWV